MYRYYFLIKWKLPFRNKCVLKLFDHYDHTKIIIVSLIDNLQKGAASQAVQCFNLSYGFNEDTALIKWKI